MERAIVLGPLIFGAAAGAAAVLLGIRRWFQAQSATPSGDILTLARRVGVRVVGGAALVTLLASPWLSQALSLPLAQVMQTGLLGVPLGLAAGLHWALRRGDGPPDGRRGSARR